MCLFLGYPSNHKGYQCSDLSTNRITISRHVTFYESSFPFANMAAPPSPSDFDFLETMDYMPHPIGSWQFAGTPSRATGPAAPDGASPQAVASGTGSSVVSDVPVQRLATSSRGLHPSFPSLGSSAPTPPASAVAGSELASPVVPDTTVPSPARRPPPGFPPLGLSLQRDAPSASSGPGSSLPTSYLATPDPPQVIASHVGPQSVVPMAPVDNMHSMTTRGKTGFRVLV